MLIFPAIDLYDGKAVRLYKGDYSQMTVYSEDPVALAKEFAKAGAARLHIVDLEGAKLGTTPHLEIIRQIIRETSLFVEVGGGIRNMKTVHTYLGAGVNRVILGTAAVTDEAFLREAVMTYGERIAVGVDIKDSRVAIKGWTVKSSVDPFHFCRWLEEIGISTIICTDISKDGAMQGTNRELYRKLSGAFKVNIIASGGISSIDDIEHLKSLDLHGAIIGKAYYTGKIDLKQAIEVASE